jgi:hypothetical protein
MINILLTFAEILVFLNKCRPEVLYLEESGPQLDQLFAHKVIKVEAIHGLLDGQHVF